jgi:tetratricopeptide (TPR) repeat protein
MWRLIAASALLAAGFADCSQAGDKEDWALCAAEKRTGNIAACTRLIARGALSQEDLAVAHYNRGTYYYFGNDDHVRGLADLDKAVALDPSYSNAFYNRGLLHRDRGAFDNAINDFTSYITLNPDEWDGYYERGYVWQRKGDPDRALDDLEISGAFDPKAQVVMLIKGLALTDKGNTAAALAEFDKVIAVNPRNEEAYYLRAYVHHRAQQAGPALADVQKALAIESNFAAASTLMGQLLEARGDPKAARVRYSRALASKDKLVHKDMAIATARDRLAALSGQTATAQSPTSGAKKQDCRKFIPGAGTTIAVECGDQ